MFKRKSSSAVLLGSAAASMAACSAQNTAKAINVLDVLKAPWVAERWLSYDSWVELNKMVGVNPLVAIFICLPALCLAAAWVAYNGLIIAGVCSVIKGVLNCAKQKRNKAMLKEIDENSGENIDKIDEFTKKLFNKEDFSFVEKIEAKYGKGYSDSLKESFLKYLLKSEVGTKTISCEKYFEDFVLDNPESEEYFNKYKNNAEKDYGLIGPKVVTKDDKKFIEEELPKLKEELDFLKKNSSAGKNEEKDSPEKEFNFENDEGIFESFRSSYIKYCHLCNKREKAEKQEDKKKRNSLTAKEYFFGAYTNNISAEKAINGFEYLVSGGNDYSVSKYWSEKGKSYGLKYKNQYFSKVLNYVSNEEYDLFNEMLRKASGKETDRVKDCFKDYVIYLHGCNKKFEKAEKSFKNFLEEGKI